MTGLDVFSIPFGPVRSGVFEAIQFQIETGGEDVLRLQTRPFFKHRGLEARLVGLAPDRAVHVAERIAGIASVAYASAFSQAVERALGIDPPARAQRWRAVHAELERIACHLDVIAKEAETTALYVGQARFQILKEQTMRIRARADRQPLRPRVDHAGRRALRRADGPRRSAGRAGSARARPAPRSPAVPGDGFDDRPTDRHRPARRASSWSATARSGRSHAAQGSRPTLATSDRTAITAGSGCGRRPRARGRDGADQRALRRAGRIAADPAPGHRSPAPPRRTAERSAFTGRDRGARSGGPRLPRASW